MVYASDGTLFSNKKEYTADTCNNNRDESQKHGKQKTWDAKDTILHMVGFHLYEILAKVDLVYSVRK